MSYISQTLNLQTDDKCNEMHCSSGWKNYSNLIHVHLITIESDDYL